MIVVDPLIPSDWPEATFAENDASLRLQERCGFRVVGRRDRIGRWRGVWRSTVLTERRSRLVGVQDEPEEPAPAGTASRRA